MPAPPHVAGCGADGPPARTRREGSTNALVMSRGGARSFGELRHHCAVENGSLYIVGVWESGEHIPLVQ